MDLKTFMDIVAPLSSHDVGKMIDDNRAVPGIGLAGCGKQSCWNVLFGDEYPHAVKNRPTADTLKEWVAKKEQESAARCAAKDAKVALKVADRASFRVSMEILSELRQHVPEWMRVHTPSYDVESPTLELTIPAGKLSAILEALKAYEPTP